MTKLVQARWLDIGLVLFCKFKDLDSVSVHKHAKRTWPISSHLDFRWSIIHIYYTDTSVLLENTPLVKFTRNCIQDSSGIYSISSLAKTSMISLMSSLSLKLFSNLLVYHQNIFESPSIVFGNLQKVSGNIRVTFRQVLENLRKVV